MSVPPDWPNRAHSRSVDTGDVRWHVQVAGDGEPLLLLHGTGASTHSWRGLMPLLGRDFTVIAPDLPRHGFTAGRPPGGMTMPAIARAIGDLLAALDRRPGVIVGHSAGAAIALRMILDGTAAPRAVIGLNAALLPFPGLGAALFPTVAKLLFLNPFAPHIFAGLSRGGDTARFLARSTGSRIDAAGVAHYARLLRAPDHVAGALAMMAEWDLDALKRDLPHLRTPLLLVHGDADRAIPLAAAREAASLVPGARLDVLAGLGHLAHEEQPETVAALIRGFAKEKR